MLEKKSRINILVIKHWKKWGDGLKEEQVIEVIDKLVGGFTPIGETNYDKKAKKNLEVIIEITGHYVDEIFEIAQMNSYLASIQSCQEIAKDFVEGLRDAYESLDG